MVALKYLCGLIFAILLVGVAFHLDAFAKPKISISPSCGSKDGFLLSVKANGFTPNSIVTWNVADSDKSAPITGGYFHTDSNGDFNNATVIEDVKAGNYQIYFGYDSNIDGVIDSEIDHSDIKIPC
jgi:hypothetical protein